MAIQRPTPNLSAALPQSLIVEIASAFKLMPQRALDCRFGIHQRSMYTLVKMSAIRQQKIGSIQVFTASIVAVDGSYIR
jgi:hypothetical protein